MHPQSHDIRTMAAHPTRLSDEILNQLTQDIHDGRLAAGTQLTEAALIERFKVSRTPVREALHRLAALGLVEPLSRQGMMVRGLSVREYVGVIEVVTELEGMAARLAARRMTQEERQALALAHEKGRRAVENDAPDDYQQANAEFHGLIYAGSCNEVLAQQIRSLRMRTAAGWVSFWRRPGRLVKSCDEHERVLRAIMEGDEEAAYLAMTQHISVGGQVYAELVAVSPEALPLARLT